MTKQSKNIVKNIGRTLLSLLVWFLVVILWIPLLIISWIVNKFTPFYHKYKVICVVGKTGAGKSLFKTYIEKRLKHKSKYIWSNINQANFDWVKDTPFECLFDKGQPRFNLADMGIDMISMDEIQNEFNNRDFADKAYKNIFDPFAKALSIHRHLKIPTIIFYTQDWNNVDVKIKRITHKIVEIENRKGLDFGVVYNAIKNRKKIDLKKVWRVKVLKGIIWEPQDYENPQKRQYVEGVKKGFFNTQLQLKDLERFKLPVSKELLAEHNTYMFENTYKHLKSICIEKLPCQLEWSSMSEQEKLEFFEKLGG